MLVDQVAKQQVAMFEIVFGKMKNSELMPKVQEALEEIIAEKRGKGIPALEEALLLSELKMLNKESK